MRIAEHIINTCTCSTTELQALRTKLLADEKEDRTKRKAAIVYCHEALHLQDMAQDAGYKAPVEKWDSDSDSDESEDEADLMV